MLPSFLSPAFSASGDFKAKDLAASCLQHMKTRRLDAGERFLVLDGAGHVFECENLSRKLDTFRVLESTRKQKLQPEIELCVSPPKGEDLWELITQATEIGASSLVFIRSEFNQYPKSAKTPPFERAQRVSNAAVEQCARPWLMSIHPEWQELTALLSEKDTSHWVADEAFEPDGEHEHPNQGKIRLYIGCEGGWSERERQIFDEYGTRSFSLGPLILRVPTAAVAAIYHLRLLSRPVQSD